MPVGLKEFFTDRLQINSLLIVLCFLSVLSLHSQSAASYPTYLLALSMALTIPRWNDVFRTRIVWVVAALLLYLCFSSFWSEPFDLRKAIGIFVRGLLIFTFVVAIAECQQRGQIQRWLGRALALTGSVVIVIALVVFYLDQPDDGRLNGLGQLDTHVIAALVYGVVLILVLDSLMKEVRNTWRSLAIVSIVLIAIAVFLSDSRNAWVSVTCGVAVFVFAHQITDRQRFAVALLVVGLLGTLALALLFANEASRDFVLPRGDSFRLDIWAQTLARIADGGVLFGLGIITPDGLAIDGEYFKHPHNMYLAVLFQGGLVGLALLVALLVATLRSLYDHYELADAKLAMGVLAIALSSYILDGHELVDKVGETWFLFWLPVAISLGLRWSRPTE